MGEAALEGLGMTPVTLLGEEVPCPECGETLKLNPFVCDNADRY